MVSNIFDERLIIDSSSLGDSETTVPRGYADRVCNEFAKLGARGVTVLAASGDNGVKATADATCKSNDGLDTPQFSPAFPASCPWVTTVGGTIKDGSSETAWMGSGGGFSNYFPRPAYQDAAVSKYLKGLGRKNSGLFNPSGRAYPDVAAIATDFPVMIGQSETLASGTSVAAPIFASVISNLNDQLFKEGKPSLGFLNPWLYSKGYAGLNDIKTGFNPECDTSGFGAGPGWDPITGFGTPNFEKLSTLL